MSIIFFEGEKATGVQLVLVSKGLLSILVVSTGDKL